MRWLRVCRACGQSEGRELAPDAKHICAGLGFSIDLGLVFGSVSEEQVKESLIRYCLCSEGFLCENVSYRHEYTSRIIDWVGAI